MELSSIRKEILSAIKISDKDRLELVEKELDLLSVTEGLNNTNNLENFYAKWKSGKKGNKNKQNSWTAYYLGMTTKEPSGEFLPSRRAFARASFPDIDSDFDYFRREEVYAHIIDMFGRETVGNIGTYQGLKLKSVIRRVGKAIDVANAFHKGPKENKSENEAKVTEITKSLPMQIGAVLKVKTEDEGEKTIKTVEEAYQYCPEFRKYIDKYPGIREHAKNIEGIISSFGCHPAGIVIGDTPLREIAPLRPTQAGLATQFDCEDLDSLGLIKFDILALATLAVIQKAVLMIKDTYGINIDVKNLPLDDKKTFELYQSGNLIGVFQCENKWMQETIRQIGVSNFDEIMVAIALYRPGPMNSIPKYVNAKKGLVEIDYYHPSLEKLTKPILEKTYGVMCYQEQIMQICNAVANFSITDGYIMIKGIGKKKKDIIDRYKVKFISGCELNGIPTAVSESYWENFITPFSSYGFNAAHCLDGKMRVYDKNSKQFFTIEDLYNNFKDNKEKIILDSFSDNNLVKDELIDIFETGEQEVFEVNLSNGMVLECTLKHKFLCSDGEIRTLEKIIEGDYEIIYETFLNE